MRYLLGLVLVAALVAGGAYVVAGRTGGPSIEIGKPEKFVGAATPLDVTVGAPGAKLTSLTVVFEQNGKQTPVYAMANPPGAELKQDGPDKVRLTREIGKQAVPEIQNGPARIIVTASRPVLYGIRTAASTATRDVQVRLERPKVSVISTHHYVNLGGTEMVVYRATPPDVTSGVLVGDLEYPGYPASGAGAVDGVKIDDPAVRIAFFALRYDQDLNTPIRLFARDEAGNTRARRLRLPQVPEAVQEEPSSTSSDALLDRIVPAILEGTTDVKPEGDTLAKFLVINGELRRKNAEKIASFAKQIRPGNALARRRLSPVHEQRRGVGVRGSAHISLQGQGSGSPGPSGLRPRLLHRHADPRGRTGARCSSPTSSASTGTA